MNTLKCQLFIPLIFVQKNWKCWHFEFLIFIHTISKSNRVRFSFIFYSPSFCWSRLPELHVLSGSQLTGRFFFFRVHTINMKSKYLLCIFCFSRCASLFIMNFILCWLFRFFFSLSTFLVSVSLVSIILVVSSPSPRCSSDWTSIIIVQSIDANTFAC